MPNKNTLERWQARQKARSLRMLDELSKRIKKEQLIVQDAGFWPSNVSNEIIFRFVVISKDSQRESTEINQVL